MSDQILEEILQEIRVLKTELQIKNLIIQNSVLILAIIHLLLFLFGLITLAKATVALWRRRRDEAAREEVDEIGEVLIPDANN